MTYVTYILHSIQLVRYYAGHCKELDKRLIKHLSNHKGYTSKAQDWVVFYSVEFDSKTDAIILEQKIKKRGIARFLDDNKKSA